MGSLKVFPRKQRGVGQAGILSITEKTLGNDRPDSADKENDVNSEKQQDKNRELTDLELDAVSGGGYVYNPATPMFMNPDNRNAIAQSHELSAVSFV